MKVQTVKSYRCPICRSTYDLKKDAEKCLAQGKDDPVAKVGDIVTLNYGRGWYDGDRKWVVNPELGNDKDPTIPSWKKKDERVKKNHPEDSNCFDSCCTMGFYYVVTKIDYDPRDKHRIRYHVFTKAMQAASGYSNGYTFNSGHYKPCKVENPPLEVLEESKKLIGRTANDLFR